MATSYFIIVDDRDPNVTTTGQVQQPAGLYQEFRQTDTRFSYPGPSVSLNFWGTSVVEYHTFAPQTAPGLVSFVLDGSSSTNTSFSPTGPEGIIEHYAAFTASGLVFGPHTLTTSMLTNGTPTSSAPTPQGLMVDYWIVTRPLDANVSGLALLYDDSHPDFVWGDGWTALSGLEYHDSLGWTIHGAAQAGSIVSLPFTGSSIEIVASVAANATAGNPLVTISIDSQVVTNVVVPDKLPASDSAFSVNRVMYESANIMPGEHTLQMTAMAPNLFFLDYLVVTGIGQVGGSGTGAGTGTGSGLGSSIGGSPGPTSGGVTGDPGAAGTGSPAVTVTDAGSSGTITLLPSPSSDTDSSSRSSSHSLSTGIIALISSICCVAFLLVSLAFFALRRHRRRRRRHFRTRSNAAWSSGSANGQSVPVSPFAEPTHLVRSDQTPLSSGFGIELPAVSPNYAHYSRDPFNDTGASLTMLAPDCSPVGQSSPSSDPASRSTPSTLLSALVTRTSAGPGHTSRTADTKAGHPSGSGVDSEFTADARGPSLVSFTPDTADNGTGRPFGRDGRAGGTSSVGIHADGLHWRRPSETLSEAPPAYVSDEEE